MNIKKINRLIVDSFSKNETVKICKDDDKVYIVLNKVCVFIIQDTDFIFDISKFEDSLLAEAQLVSIKSLIGSSREEALKTTFMRSYTKASVAVLFETSYHKIHVDKKYLSYFREDSVFRLTDSKKALIVYDNNDCIGLILGVNIPE